MSVSIKPGRDEPARGEGTHACWSRRRVVAHGFLMLAAAPLLAGAGRKAAEPPPGLSTTDPPGSPPKGTDNGIGAGSGSVRAASLTDNRLTTAVYINDVGPYRFLVDTGAERSLMAAEIAAELGLPQGPKVMVEGILRDLPGVLVGIRSLRMGSLVCPPLEVPVLPRPMLGVDGYLGLDVLDRHRVVLDFQAQKLSVTRPQGFFAALWERPDEVIVRTLGTSGRLRASNCTVNGVPAGAFIDTGAEVSVINPALYAQLQRHSAPRELVGGPVQLAGVTGGSVEGLAIQLDEIVLGELHLTYMPMVVAPLDVFDVWGLKDQPALLFGMDCLRRFRRVSIDYGRKELRFEVASARLPQPLQAALPLPLSG
ncbi:MAG TPA: retroviral-like aspartic protease family protein [Steroidobacteraceae bacterium]|nr:retroviral-like aspartic protease family protein [Steroidobacteraceae bacterium]